MKPSKNINGRDDWRYSTAAESVKPGYLQRKFAKIREQLKKQETEENANREEQLLKVRRI